MSMTVNKMKIILVLVDQNSKETAKGTAYTKIDIITKSEWQNYYRIVDSLL